MICCCCVCVCVFAFVCVWGYRACSVISALASSPEAKNLLLQMDVIERLVVISKSRSVESRFWDAALAIAKLVGDQEVIHKINHKKANRHTHHRKRKKNEHNQTKCMSQL